MNSSPSSKPKILLAEDDPHVQQMVTILLEEAGYDIRSADTGAGCLAIFDEFAPDLVLLDIYLPFERQNEATDFGERIGFELCRRLRRHPLGIEMPILFLTSLIGEERVVEGLDAGADDYIVKPFRPKELLARIRCHVGRLDRTRRAERLCDGLAPGARIEGNEGRIYRIDSKISRGGMGVVYLAEELGLNRQVAIKTLDAKYLREKKELQRFLREAKATCELDHPNLARGLEVVTRDDLCFYAMEFVPGRTVSELVEREGPVEQRRACRLMLQVGRGLAHLESRSLIHRDVKPENIILDDNDHATLVDFGLSKPVHGVGSFTTEGIILGTPYYLSPEQVKGQRNLDIRSDLFSLGTTFYLMLTGSKPFEGETTVGIINQRLFQDPVPVARRNGLVSPSISRIVQKMMARAIEERYSSPKQVIHDLGLVLNGAEPVCV